MDIKCIRATFEPFEGGRDVFRSPDFERDDRKGERTGRCLDLTHLLHGCSIAAIEQDRQPANTGDNLA